MINYQSIACPETAYGGVSAAGWRNAHGLDQHERLGHGRGIRGATGNKGKALRYDRATRFVVLKLARVATQKRVRTGLRIVCVFPLAVI